MSPGRRAPGKTSSAACTEAGMAPKCTGTWAAWDTMSPWGLNTAQEKSRRGGYEEIQLAGKEIIDVEAGDVISIRTPGGGGWGAPGDSK